MKDNTYVFITGCMAGLFTGCGTATGVLISGLLSGIAAMAGKDIYIYVRKNWKVIMQKIKSWLRLK